MNSTQENSWRQQTILITWLTFFAAWPLLHVSLVWFARIDPWKLGGWGMYSTTRNQIGLQFSVYDGEGKLLFSDVDVPGESRRQAEAFARKRRNIGKFADPSELATTIFDNAPAASNINILVHLIHLDNSSRTLTAETESFHYARTE